MVLGILAMLFCHPTLAPRLGVGAGLFLGYYTAFLLGLEWTAPGYVERVWNLPALSGLEIAGLPMEEFLFAAALSACLSCIYDHLVRHRPYKVYASLPSLGKARWPKKSASFRAPVFLTGHAKGAGTPPICIQFGGRRTLPRFMWLKWGLCRGCAGPGR
jgi:hypothetical protein